MIEQNTSFVNLKFFTQPFLYYKKRLEIQPKLGTWGLLEPLRPSLTSFSIYVCHMSSYGLQVIKHITPAQVEHYIHERSLSTSYVAQTPRPLVFTLNKSNLYISIEQPFPQTRTTFTSTSSNLYSPQSIYISSINLEHSKQCLRVSKWMYRGH